MKATAIAPSNIALVKYWGKASETLRIPANDSLSMNMSVAVTTTTVEFLPKHKSDDIRLMDGTFTKAEKDRIIAHLNRIRAKAGIFEKAKVVTKNSFPKGTGIASSASGFAALTVAGCAASGLVLTEKESTTLARLGSGSACRSIPDGFVLWKAGKTHESSYARSVFPADYWDIRDIVVILETKEKAVTSTSGMNGASTSPFWNTRTAGVKDSIENVMAALRHKDIQLLGETIEQEALNMHAVMMTQKPPLFYWSHLTLRLIQALSLWRAEGIPVYFTLDAGPNVHLLCEAKDEERVVARVKTVIDNPVLLISKPSVGTKITSEHLF
jgi:diphosphomevalonate decarboxylase